MHRRFGDIGMEFWFFDKINSPFLCEHINKDEPDIVTGCHVLRAWIALGEDDFHINSIP
jgi:hypothetical protein